MRLGGPWPFVEHVIGGRFSHFTILAFIEPGLGLVLGILLARVDPAAGLFLCVAAVGATAKTMLLFADRRGEMLDRADAEEFAKFSQEYSADMSGNGTQGTTQMPASVVR